MPAQRFIGLMSGTSMDGIDAGLLTVDKGAFRLERGITVKMPRLLHGRLATLIDNAHSVALDELGQLDTALGHCFADAALQLIAACGLEPGGIRAIGSHGQTVRHGATASSPFTLQIGNPAVIATRTGIDTVADFRRRDLALGGQGAPLAPGFHQAAFASRDEQRVVLNIGGIGNITILHPDGSVSGHDTGPGNVLMDAWCRENRGTSYDAAGDWARSGRVDRTLLELFLQEPFFARAPPKSTGRELFNLQWVVQRLQEGNDRLAHDVQATLCELSARSIADAIHRYAPNARRCLVCGGGTHNFYLLERLAAGLGECELETTDAYGLQADYVEAAAFGWLAWRFVSGRPGNVPTVTGARDEAILGSITPA